MSSIFRISNNSGLGPVQSFVSVFVGSGDDNWFTLPLNYSDHSLSDWTRSPSWESVMFEDQDGKRRGFYLEGLADTILKIQFYSC